ncbi:MAG: rhodanese-like domain-containing protein [Desulfobacterales bacterium]
MVSRDPSFQDAIAEVKRTQRELDKRVFHLNTLYETACELTGLNQPRKMMETFLLSTMGIFGITQGLVILINVRTYQGHLCSRGFSEEEVAACARNLTKIARHYLPPEKLPISTSATRLPIAGKVEGSALLPDSVKLLVKRMVDESFAVVVALGECFTGNPPEEADIETLLSLTGTLTNALAQTLSQHRIQNLNADLARQGAALEESLRQAKQAREDLDRRVFHLHTLYEFTAELIPIASTESLMEAFLLMVIGTFGLSQGFVLLCDRDKRKCRCVSRGSDIGGEPNFESTEKRLYKAFQCTEDRRLDSMSVTFIKQPERVFPQSETGFAVNTVYLFTVQSSLLGLVGLGTPLSRTALNDDERTLLRGLTANFMVFLKNARAFEKIQALNEDLRGTNEDLRRTITDLTEARNQIRLLELAKNRLKQVVQREIERADRFRITDVLLIILIATLLSLPFNYASPNKLKILPESFSVEAPVSIDVTTTHQLFSEGAAVIVDARPAELFAHKHISEAINIPASLFDIIFPMKLGRMLNSEMEIIVYGRTFSKRYDEDVVWRLLQRHDKVKILEGGLAVWEMKGYSVTP